MISWLASLQLPASRSPSSMSGLVSSGAASGRSCSRGRRHTRQVDSGCAHLLATRERAHFTRRAVSSHWRGASSQRGNSRTSRTSGPRKALPGNCVLMKGGGFCEEIPVSISSTCRRAALLRGLSAPEGALAPCRSALERCFAALRPRRSAALLVSSCEPDLLTIPAPSTWTFNAAV